MQLRLNTRGIQKKKEDGRRVSQIQLNGGGELDYGLEENGELGQ